MPNLIPKMALPCFGINKGLWVTWILKKKMPKLWQWPRKRQLGDELLSLLVIFRVESYRMDWAFIWSLDGRNPWSNSFLHCGLNKRSLSSKASNHLPDQFFVQDPLTKYECRIGQFILNDHIYRMIVTTHVREDVMGSD